MSHAADDTADRVHVFRRLWQSWKRIAYKIGDAQARILLTIFYFLIVAPFALAIRLFTDPLSLKPGSAKGWRPRQTSPPGLEQARRQF